MSIWSGRRVVVTGHTGFKGAWLSYWLASEGANVVGLSLPPANSGSLFEVLDLPQAIQSVFVDVRDEAAVLSQLKAARPDVVFHLAAQALVRESYRAPAETFATNVIGTSNVLDAIRVLGGVRGVLVVTSDKCYEPTRDARPFREEDRLGGHDPYSASKACAEIVTASYRDSFLSAAGTIVATARAGNVIGGGDWSPERLIPDLVRAEMERRPVVLRFPNAIRPWQHVFDPLRAYLMLGERMLRGDGAAAGAWNIGPADGETLTVKEVVEKFQRLSSRSYGVTIASEGAAFENPRLLLDATKARRELGWQPRYDTLQAIEHTSLWYRAFLEKSDMPAFSRGQLEQYARLG